MDSPLFRPGAITAATCTIVQAVAWMVLSLLGLLASTKILGPETLDDMLSYGYADTFGLQMIACYFPRNDLMTCCTDKLILGHGTPMLAVSIVYLLASIAWLITGILLVQDLTNKERNIARLTQAWAGVTLSISLLDFVVAILFGIDYRITLNKCSVLADVSDVASYMSGVFLLAIIGVLMTLAARGYVLWLANVIVAVLLLRSTFGKTIGNRSRRSSNSSGSSVYQSPTGGLQDSRSMVFQRGDRPWGPGDPPQRDNSAPQPPPWDRSNSTSPGPSSAEPTRNPLGYVEQDVKRGGLASRMSMKSPSRGPAPQPPAYNPPVYQQPQKPQPTPKRPTSMGTTIPEPDYDASNLPRVNQQPRSVLKKTPTTPSPAANDWRQPSPQQNTSPYSPSNGWSPQTPVPITPDGRGGWAAASTSENRWGGYDNRGYDAQQGGSNSGRTGF